jgi:hypothetical protein
MYLLGQKAGIMAKFTIYVVIGRYGQAGHEAGGMCI